MRWLALVAILTLATLPTIAAANCGSGLPASYDDIDAVMLKQDGCGGTIGSLTASRRPGWFAKSFECSAYWAFFWNNGRENVPTEYSQYNLKDSVGAYRLSVTIADARDVLRKDKFFSLSPPDGYITDTAQAVISVQRCAVTTRIRIFTGQGNAEPATARLFADLANLIRLSAKTKVSEIPKEFGLTGLFDPLP